MIIDGHAHPGGDYFNGESIIRALDENKVDLVILAGSPEKINKKKRSLSIFTHLTEKYPQSFIYIINKIIKAVNTLSRSVKELDSGNQYVYNLVKQFPYRIIQFYWVNPNKKDFIDELNEKYNQYHFRGLKLHQCITKFDLKKDYMHDIAKWAEEKRMPIFIHLCSKKDAIDMVELIKQHKNTNFIIAHLIGLEVFIDANIDTSNILFDISCYQIVPKITVELAVEKFGVERIIMGSDTPNGEDNLKNSIALIQGLELSDKEKEQILGGNLKKLLRIG